MVKYKVIISQAALENLKFIYDYLKNEVSLQTAQKVRSGILATIQSLETMPMRFEVMHEISDEKIIFRKVSKWSYKVIYTIDSDKITVSVIDIIHEKQSY